MITPSLLEQPVEYLLSWLESDRPRSLIAIVGVPGSGKSTLAARLAAEVNACAGTDLLVALGMDGFHLTRAELWRMPDPIAAFARRGAPWTFDVEALRQRLQDLRSAEGIASVPWPDFQHEIGDPVEAVRVVAPTARLIIIEGLYLLYQADGWETIGPLFDERWYLDTPFDIAMERLVQRHMSAWGLTRAAATSRIITNDRLNAEIVAASRPYADWRLTS